MRKLFLCVVMMCVSIGYAQEIPNIIPSNPEVASLGKYVDTPVSLAYGLPNVSVPLFSIGNKDVNVPVSLSYHASGIRVSEMASRVGLGWSLNAGGMISRSVRGLPDDYPNNGYINTTNTVASFMNLSVANKANMIVPTNGHIYDYESDIFQFNFLGYSGKFFFTQSGVVVGNPTNDLKIVPIKNNQGNIEKWEVTTPDGVKYYFGKSKDNNRVAANKSTNASFSKGLSSGFTIPDPSTPMTNYTTAWYLLDIETPKRELISLTYASSVTSFFNLTGQHQELGVGSGVSSNPFQTFYSHSINELTHRVTSISCNNGSISFVYDSTQREDLDNDYALRSVILKDKHNTVIDQYNLVHKYFVSPHTTHEGIGKLNQCLKRLYLEEVIQQKGSEKNQRHKFEYHTEHILPHRFSYAIDHWGYYNGKNNSVLHPKIKLLVGTTMRGADRKVDETYAKACMLKKIIHPTGGSTEFEFESNNVANVSLINLVGVEEVYVNGLNSANISGNQEEKIITINNIGQDYDAGLSFKYNFTRECTNPNGLDCPKVMIYEYNTHENKYELISESLGVSKTLEHIRSYAKDESTTFKIVINNFSNDFNGGRNDVNVSIYGKRKVLDAEQGGKTGGLRIKRIKKLDSDNKVLFEKKYEYTYFNNPSKTSGSTLSPPEYVLNTFFMDKEERLRPLIIVKSNSIFPITNASSYSSIYHNVTEYNKDENNGKTTYEFSFVHNGAGAIEEANLYSRHTTNDRTEVKVTNTKAPYIYSVPTGDYSHRRGNLIHKKVYKRIGNEYSLLAETTNYYSPTDRDETLYADNILVGYAVNAAMGGYKRYQNLSESFHLDKTVQKSYSESGVITQSAINVYDKGRNGRTFPIIKKIIDSKGDTLITHTKYAKDLNNAILLNAHRIAEPLETITTKKVGANSIQLSHQKTIYDTQHNPHSIYLPKIIQASKLNQSLEDRIVYHKYDSKGNPVEVSKKDGTKIYYVWGYNSTQPIAKIEHYTGMTNDQLSIINAAISASNLDTNSTTENNLRVALNNIRTAFPKAMVTTLTYDPLIGTTSVTDPRGETMYYQYDNFNRLKFIKDAQGNILKEHKYNYKN